MSGRRIRRDLSILVLSLVLLTLGANAIIAQPALQSTVTPIPSGTATAFLPTLPPLPSQIASRTPLATVTPVGIASFLTLGFTVEVLPANTLHVIGVLPNSVAQRSGLLIDDVITAVEGQIITANNVNSFIRFLTTTRTSVRLTISRRGQTLSLILTTVLASPTRFPTPTVSPALGKLGVAYQIVTEQLASEKNLSVTYGAYILEVDDNKPAAISGIQVGDVITEVDGDKVDAKRTLAMRMMPYNMGDELILTVVRGGETIKVKVLLVNLRNIAGNLGAGDIG